MFLQSLRFKVFVLISTYWNVNSLIGGIVPFLRSVLISTYWNVNNNSVSKEEKIEVVLISTYWNVNSYNNLPDSSTDRF